MNSYCLTGLLLLLTITTHSQGPYTLKGFVRDQQAPLHAASVTLLLEKDSTPVKTALSSTAGSYAFTGIGAGRYCLRVTAVGYQSHISAAFNLQSDLEAVPVMLTAVSQTLGNVTVTARKPLMETRIDRTIINVEAAPTNAGITVLELLAKAPGVTVDADGNISLKGKQGVMVLMDGKPTYLSGQDLASLLKSMSAAQLEQVEIMTQPPAKYDAAGNAGIINLRSKRMNKAGINGNLSLGYVQGFYPRSPNTANFNYRKGKLNFSANLGYTYLQLYTNQTLYRKFTRNRAPYLFDQAGRNVNTSHNITSRFGIDYAVDSTTQVSLSVNNIHFRRASDNITNGRFLPLHQAEADSSIHASNTMRNRNRNTSININARKQYDKKGRELNLDLDLIQYRGTLDLYTDNRSVYVNQPLVQYLLKGLLPTDIDVYSGKLDYTHPLRGEAKWEAGIKASLVKTENDAPYQKYNEGTHSWEDDIRKDHFAYDEQIGAAYINYAGKWGKWEIQAGLRTEYTHSTGKQVLIGKQISRDYWQLFPTAYIRRTINKDHQAGLSYSRRIDRPNYQDLNPFQRFLDLYTYNQGNPYLSPQFAHNIELSHSYKNQLITTLNYTYTDKVINDVIRQNDATKVIFQTKENVSTKQSIGIGMTYVAPITKWWTLNVNGNFYQHRFTGEVNETGLDRSTTSFDGNFDSQFNFAGTWNAGINGSYQTRVLITSMFTMRPMYVLSIGIGKQILKKKASLRLNLVDPFQWQQSVVEVAHDNVDMVVHNRWDNRRLALTFTWRFSKGTAIQQRKKGGGASDEQKRIG